MLLAVVGAPTTAAPRAARRSLFGRGVGALFA